MLLYCNISHIHTFFKQADLLSLRQSGFIYDDQAALNDVKNLIIGQKQVYSSIQKALQMSYWPTNVDDDYNLLRFKLK